MESPHGYHIWFRSEGEFTGPLKKVPELAFDHVYVGRTVEPRPWSQIELRWAKAYLIIPPTSLTNHGGSTRYRWLSQALFKDYTPVAPPAYVDTKVVEEVFVGLVDGWDFHLPDSPYDPYDEWEEPEDNGYDDYIWGIDEENDPEYYDF